MIICLVIVVLFIVGINLSFCCFSCCCCCCLICCHIQNDNLSCCCCCCLIHCWNQFVVLSFYVVFVVFFIVIFKIIICLVVVVLFIVRINLLFCHFSCHCCLIHCLQYDCCWIRFQQQIWILLLKITGKISPVIFSLLFRKLILIIWIQFFSDPTLFCDNIYLV